MLFNVLYHRIVIHLSQNLAFGWPTHAAMARQNKHNLATQKRQFSGRHLQLFEDKSGEK